MEVVLNGKQFMVTLHAFMHNIKFHVWISASLLLIQHVVFHCKNVTQIVLDAALYQRTNPTIVGQESNAGLTLNGSNLGITTHQVPLAGELANLLALHIVLEHHDTTANEVALGSTCLRIVGVCGICSIPTIVRFALSVEHVVHCFVRFFIYLAVDFVRHSILSGIHSTVFQSLQETLSIGSSSKGYHDHQ